MIKEEDITEGCILNHAIYGKILVIPRGCAEFTLLYLEDGFISPEDGAKGFRKDQIFSFNNQYAVEKGPQTQEDFEHLIMMHPSAAGGIRVWNRIKLGYMDDY